MAFNIYIVRVDRRSSLCKKVEYWGKSKRYNDDVNPLRT